MTNFKKYHNVLMLPAMIVIMLSLLSGFTTRDDEELLKSLLIERTHILQDGYFDIVAPDITEAHLSEIETYPLLTEDIRNFRSMQETDFNRVERMTFADVKKKQSFMGYTTYEVEIIWDMRGPEGTYESHGKYHTVLKQSGEKVHLSKFVLLE